MIRKDLRSSKQTRDLAIVLGGIAQADGAARVTLGNTTVIATVAGPAAAKYSRHEKGDRGNIEIEISDSSSIPKSQHGYFLLTEFVRRALSGAVQLEKFPRQLITIKVTVMENSGSLVSTIINACTLAMLDASLSMNFYLSCAEVGMIQNDVFLDLTDDEEKICESTMIACFVADESIADLTNSSMTAMEVHGSCNEAQQATLLENAHAYAKALNLTIRDAITRKYAFSS